MKNKPALVEGKKYVITGATEHSISKSVGVYFPQVVTYTGGEFDGVEPKHGLSKRWPVSNFEYKELKTTKVRIKPYRNGFRFEITFANGKKPNHVYNTRAAAKKGLKALAEALTNYEIVK